MTPERQAARLRKEALLSSPSPKPAAARRRGSTPASSKTNGHAGSHPVGHLNAWRLHRQWLDRPFRGRSLLDLIRSSGWLYSPGCSTPYLSLWARTSAFRPASLDRLVFKDHKLIQIETLRGCTMLVPREHAAIALRVRSRTFTELARQARSLIPLTEEELDRLKRAVTEVLRSGPASYAELAGELPPELVRPFPAGLRRVGLNGSLWLAINLLKEEGRILKVQASKRLDSTAYVFALVSAILPELDVFRLRSEHANTELAAHYFTVEGPARVRDFAWWAGLHVTEAMRAVEALEPGLVPVAVADSPEEFLISESEIDSFRRFRPSDQPSVALIPYRDMYLKGQREIVNRFVREADFDKPFSRWKGKLINDPVSTIVADGRVIGIWEWSPEDGIAYVLFDDDDSEWTPHVEGCATKLAAFIQKDLGAFRLQGLSYGKNQMTGIHQLRDHWGQGAEARLD